MMKHSSSSDDSFDLSSDFDDSFDDGYSSFETSSSSSKIEVAPLTPKVIDDSVDLYFEFSLRRFRHVKELNLFAACSTSADSSSASAYHWDTLSEAMAKIFVVVSENLKSLVRNDKILDEDAATIVRKFTPRLINLIKQGSTKVVESIYGLETSVKKRPEPPKTPVTTSIKRLEDSFAHSITRTPRSAATPNEPTSLATRTLNFQDALVIAPAADQGLGTDVIATVLIADSSAADISTQPSSPSMLDHAHALSDDLPADGVDIFAKTYANTVDQNLSSRSPSPTQVGLFTPSTVGNASSPSLPLHSPSSTQTALFSTSPTTDSAAHAASGNKEAYFKSTLALWKQREREGFNYSERPHPSSRTASSLMPDSIPTPASTPTRRSS